jgi:hypothetical protein
MHPGGEVAGEQPVTKCRLEPFKPQFDVVPDNEGETSKQKQDAHQLDEGHVRTS